MTRAATPHGGQWIFDGQYLRAELYEAPGGMAGGTGGGTGGGSGAGPLMVTFDYRRKNRDAFGTGGPSRGFARAGFSQLIIRTAANDWFVNAETEALEGALAGLAPNFGPVRALGFSMGGYGALRFARALGLRSLVAVSPQVSIDPAVVPFDRRYRAESSGFDPRVGALRGREVRGLAGIVVIDPTIRADLRHARMIRNLFPGLRLARLAFGGHPASRVLRDAGKGGVLQRAAMSDPPDAAAIVLAHRTARAASGVYDARRAAALERRAVRQARLAEQGGGALG